MYYADFFDFSLWWIFPIVMMVLCFLMMRGRRGRGMCGFGVGHGTEESPIDILNKRYARGEIDQKEYEEKKRTLET